VSREAEETEVLRAAGSGDVDGFCELGPRGGDASCERPRVKRESSTSPEVDDNPSRAPRSEHEFEREYDNAGDVSPVREGVEGGVEDSDETEREEELEASEYSDAGGIPGSDRESIAVWDWMAVNCCGLGVMFGVDICVRSPGAVESYVLYPWDVMDGCLSIHKMVNGGWFLQESAPILCISVGKDANCSLSN